jgi:hypothetical protein
VENTASKHKVVITDPAQTEKSDDTTDTTASSSLPKVITTDTTPIVKAPEPAPPRVNPPVCDQFNRHTAKDNCSGEDRFDRRAHRTQRKSFGGQHGKWLDKQRPGSCVKGQRIKDQRRRHDLAG